MTAPTQFISNSLCVKSCFFLVVGLTLCGTAFILTYNPTISPDICPDQPIKSQVFGSTPAITEIPFEIKKNTGLEKLENVTIQYRDSAISSSKRCGRVKGRRILINYAAGCCWLSQPMNCETGLKSGGFDICISFKPDSLDEDFQRRYKTMLDIGGPGAFWVWKPFIILKTLLAMEADDVLLYSDSGAIFIDNMDLGHVCLQAEFGQDIVLFSYEAVEKQFSKGDAFILMNCDMTSTDCADTHQFLATAILLRKSFNSIQFVTQWLTYAEDYRIVGNGPSELQTDHKEFKANRNDQTILSILAKKWKLSPWPDPSQNGENLYGQSLRKLPQFASISRTFMNLTRQKI